MKKQSIIKALQRAENFISGFEDDETQKGIKSMLKELRAVTHALQVEHPKKKSRILIIVEGGIVQSIMTDQDNMRAVVIDFDKQSDEPCIVAEPEVEKLKHDNFYELYTDKSDAEEMEIREELKRLKF